MCLHTKTWSLLYVPQTDLRLPRSRSDIAVPTTSSGATVWRNTASGTSVPSLEMPMKSVLTQPGETSRTRMPPGSSSLLRPSQNERT